MRIANYTDLTGQTFSFWTVLSSSGQGSDSSRTWRCKCVCGAIQHIVARNLIERRSKSCRACMHVRQRAEANGPIASAPKALPVRHYTPPWSDTPVQARSAR